MLGMKRFTSKALIAILLACSPIAAVTVPTAQAKSSIEIGVITKTKLPKGAISVKVGKQNYHTHKGVFYRKTSHGYEAVKAPKGGFIRRLPFGYKRVVVRGKTYYRFNEAFYIKVSKGFRVVEAPTEVSVVTGTTDDAPQSSDDLAAEPYSVWLKDRELILKDGQFFRTSPQGLIWVELPLGATSQQLPMETNSIWYNEIEFYESQGIYFQKTPNGYKVILPPWENVNQSE